MAQIDVPLQRIRFLQTSRKDAWWLYPILWTLAFGAGAAYLTWGLFQSNNYWVPPYLTPLASPLFFGEGPHAWFGPDKPGWWPASLPLMPGLLIGFFPMTLRMTCYYYRGSYYKSLLLDPINCAVGEPRHGYSGEAKFPLVMQNLHRITLYIMMLYIPVLAYDAIMATQFPVTPGAAETEFGIGVGTLIMFANVVLISCYTFGCHAFRHLAGGVMDRFSHAPIRKKVYDCSTCLNKWHGTYAIASMYTMVSTDLYIRLVATGVITDWRI